MKRQLLTAFMLICIINGLSAQDGDTLRSGTFTDSRDDHTYRWIRIGNQTWMAENLAFLPAVSPSTLYSNSESYFVYGYEGNDPMEAKTDPNFQTYGVLYNWEAAKTACPSGWKLPKEADWTFLTDYLGQAAGGEMKEAGTEHWIKPNTKATNGSGFTALPGGYRMSDGGFESIGRYTYFWSASEYDQVHA